VSRSVYLVDPNWVGDPEDSEQSVVEEYPDTLDEFQVVQELWRLAGNDERARHDYVPAENLPELRSRTQWLNLYDARGVDARGGIWEGVGGVWRLRRVLQQALDNGVHVALD